MRYDVAVMTPGKWWLYLELLAPDYHFSLYGRPNLFSFRIFNTDCCLPNNIQIPWVTPPKNKCKGFSTELSIVSLNYVGWLKSNAKMSLFPKLVLQHRNKLFVPSKWWPSLSMQSCNLLRQSSNDLYGTRLLIYSVIDWTARARFSTLLHFYFWF